MRGTRWAMTALTLSALALTVSACGSDPQAGDGAGAEALVIYSGRSEALVGGLLEEFTAQTGIDVSVRYGDTAELAAQLLEEGDRSPADVFFSQDAGALQALENADLLAPLPKATLGKVPAIYRSDAGEWIGTSGRSRVLFYNDEQVPEAQVPDSVLDLTDPAWKGKVGIAPTNASFQTFITAMRVTLGEDATRQWLEGLVANDVQRFDNNTAIRDAVDAGTVSLGLANHYYWFERAEEVGAENLNVQNRFLAPGDVGSLVNVAGVGVLRPSADDPNAQAFVDYLLSPSAQEFFARETKEYPLIEGVPQADGLPTLNSLKGPQVSLGQLADLAGTQQLLQEVGLL